MGRGEAKAQRGLRWYPDGETGLRHLMGVGGQKLISTWQSGAVAWDCVQCQLVLIDYGVAG